MIISSSLENLSAHENPLHSLQDTVAFSSADWGEERDRAWIYGIVLGWDDDADPDDLPELRVNTMDIVAKRCRWTPEQVARFTAAARGVHRAGRQTMTERNKHGNPISERQYSPAEIAAARKLGVCDSGHGRGTIYFAGGDWWPNHLDALAREYELQARRARVVAKALRREQARW